MIFTPLSAQVFSTSHYFVEVEKVQLPYPNKYFEKTNETRNSWADTSSKNHLSDEDKEAFETFIGTAAFSHGQLPNNFGRKVEANFCAPQYLAPMNQI
jgi:hypothetical protein